MGRFAAFLIAPASQVPEARAEALSEDGPIVRFKRSYPGWDLFNTPLHYWQEDLLERAVAATGQPVLGGYIYDGDFAYLAGATPRGNWFRLVLGTVYDTGDRNQPLLDAQINPGNPQAWAGEAGTQFDPRQLEAATRDGDDHAFVKETSPTSSKRSGVPPQLADDP